MTEEEYKQNLIRANETAINCVHDMIEVMLCETTSPEFDRKMFVSRLNIMRNTFIEKVPALIHPLFLKEAVK